MTFLGLRSAIYPVDDLSAARSWYTRALGVAPYFDQPFYVGFNVGGFELGLDPDASGVQRGARPIAYWGVSDIDAAHAKLLAQGAKSDAAIQDVGEGIRLASVRDPWGNVLGLIQNPHFKVA